MGYDTSFTGHFNVTPPLKKAHRDYLTAFAQVRHMQRDVARLENKKDPLRLAVHLHLGEEGAYFIGIPTPSRPHGDRSPTSILNHNKPPRGQPELHCQWIPSADGKQLVWDNGEKFYLYVEWLRYLVDHFLSPWGYQLNGEVSYQGQYPQDHGRVVAVKNKISIGPPRKSIARRAHSATAPKKDKVSSNFAAEIGMARFSRESLVSMLEASQGNQRTAAAQLGLNPSTLRGWMKHYNLRSEDFGPSAKPRKSAFRRERVVEVLSRTRGNQTQAAKLLGTSQSNFNHLIRQYQIAPSEISAQVGTIKKNESCQIYALSEDANEGDIAGRDYYEVCQEAEDLFHNASIRIMRDETLHEACISAEGEVMGASVIHVWDDSDRGMVLRFSVAVLEGARRQNIASRLVQSILKEAKYMDVNVVEAWVVNPVMVTLLSKLGFEEPHGGWSQNDPFMEYTG